MNFNTEEKTLIDLINTVAINKNKNDLLEDLLPEDDNDETIITPINEVENSDEIKEFITQEIRKDKIEKEAKKEEKPKVDPKLEPQPSVDKTGDLKEIDNSFYTTSMNFSKVDFEGFEDLKQTKKRSALTVIVIIVIVICIIAVAVYLLDTILDLNLIERLVK